MREHQWSWEMWRFHFPNSLHQLSQGQGCWCCEHSDPRPADTAIHSLLYKCWAVQVSPSPLPLHRLVIGASYAPFSFTGLLHNFGFVRGPSFLHCFQTVGQTGAPGAFDDHREEWCAIFRKPGRWKRLLERAERWHIYRHQAEAHFQVLVRKVWEPLPTPVVDCDSVDHACLICGFAFADCQAWSAHVAKVPLEFGAGLVPLSSQ